MVLMFAVGEAHLGWMPALAVIMFVEKAVVWGRAMTTTAGGVILTAWGPGVRIGVPGLPRPL
jgi:predicted metal-binding membrane protein